MMIMAQHYQQQQQQKDGVAGCSTSHQQQHEASSGGVITTINKQQNELASKSNTNKTTSATTTKAIHIANTNTDSISTKSRQDNYSTMNQPHKQVETLIETNVACDNYSKSKNLEQQSFLNEQDCIQQNLQEGKRTLIKNQLYLIEQLQLENANLRNERDQLQLENEELKFQLQMISSSNILSQPGATFSDRQLQKLVETSDEGEGETKLSPTIEPSEAEVATGTIFNPHAEPTNGPQASLNKPSHIISTAFSCKTTTSNYMSNRPNHYVATSQSILSKINATPSRRPMRLIGNDNGTDNACPQNILSTNCLDNDQQMVRLTALDEQTTTFSSKQTESSHSQAPCVMSLSADSDHAGNNIKFPNPKSDSLVAFEFKPSDLGTSSTKTIAKTRQFNDLCSIAGGQEDDEQLKAELVGRRYGDSVKVQAAAITIQRAFRKYQICKRFRAITEQLRHTCQSSSAGLLEPVVALVSEKPKQDIANKQQLSQVGSKASSESSSSPIPFTSGTTKVAAWESLSYAASRLAASAAAATATTKQALVNGVNKSASSQQQVASSTIATTTTTSTSTTTSTINNLAHSGNNNNNGQSRAASAAQTLSNDNNQRSNLKSDPVVAAAINFQQLESIRKRQYRVGLNIFNKNPEKGVSFLIAHSFIDMSPPYSKNSQSYYLSNQLHFIDGKQQHLSAAATNGNSRQISISSSASAIGGYQQNCHLCYEEENLKRNVAHFLLHRKGLARERIGQYLGNLQASFNQDVLRYYLQELDFHGLQIDIALRKFLSTLRLPGEAQKIERFVDCFAQRYVQCQQQQQRQQLQSSNNNLITLNNVPQIIQLKEPNSNQQQQQQQHRSAPPTPTPDRPSRASKQSIQNQSNYKNNLTLLSKDEIFILTFAIIMLNTDLHSPSLKPTSRMSASQFVHNLRGVFKSQEITESDLMEIYERVKANQITTTPDHVTHVMKVQQGLTVTNFQRKELPNLCVPHRRLVCFCRLFEVYDVNKKERVGQHQREIFLFNDLLLVTKLARRARANAAQQFAYRQSISLQGLHVQLFQTTHYNFGIRLCRKGSGETLIMFNARNELDQSRFVDDLTESIAEMDEMESIRIHKTVDAIHFKQQDRLKRHAMLHNTSENIKPPAREPRTNGTNVKLANNQAKDIHTDDERESANNRFIVIKEDNHEPKEEDLSHESSEMPGRRIQTKFSSMSNLASVAETKDDDDVDEDDNKIHLVAGGAECLRPNRSFVQQQQNHSQRLQDPRHQQDQQSRDLNNSGTHRSGSSGSVHSLDSGLFLSRDVSPNQSG